MINIIVVRARCASSLPYPVTSGTHPAAACLPAVQLPIVAVLLFHQRCLLHAYRPVAPTVVSVTEPVCAVYVRS